MIGELLIDRLLMFLNIFAYQYDWSLVEFKTTLEQQLG